MLAPATPSSSFCSWLGSEPLQPWERSDERRRFLRAVTWSAAGLRSPPHSGSLLCRRHTPIHLWPTTCFHAFTSVRSSWWRCHRGEGGWGVGGVEGQNQRVPGKPQIKGSLNTFGRSVDPKELIINTGVILDWLPRSTITNLPKRNWCMTVQVLQLVKF